MNMPKLTARLQTLNKIMGSNIADIGELNLQAEGCIERDLPNLATCPDEEFQKIADELRRYWPSYMQYHYEEDRNQP